MAAITYPGRDRILAHIAYADQARRSRSAVIAEREYVSRSLANQWIRREVGPSRSGPPVGSLRGRSERIARAATAAIEAGVSPTFAVAAMFGMSPKAARQAISRCRGYGLNVPYVRQDLLTPGDP